MKLYDYQKELLNSKEEFVIANWCRDAGFDTALAIYILENKPSNVGIFGYGSILKSLDNFKDQYDFDISTDNESLNIIFKQTERKIFIKESYKLEDFKGKHYDLIIDYNTFMSGWKFSDEIEDFLKLSSDKKIFKLSENIYDENGYLKLINSLVDNSKTKIINIDYKKLLENKQELIEKILDERVHNPKFYKEYALLDKPKNELMSFDEFFKKSLSKLQREFLNTANRHDTVLTRQNLLNMICQLVQLEKDIRN